MRKTLTNNNNNSAGYATTKVNGGFRSTANSFFKTTRTSTAETIRSRMQMFSQERDAGDNGVSELITNTD